MTHIQLQNVSVKLADGRRETKALDDVTLSVRAGEVMGVIGPTGCGKSTLLRAVAGLLPLASGRVLFDGQDQAHVPARDRGIGMVFQDYGLYSHWKVRENLSFYFKLRKREKEAPEHIREAAEILGVDFTYLMGRFPSTLSQGQRQQVAIARCLVREPRVFLMDEPFSNLDAAQRQHARVQLKRLLGRFRVTTLFVTHDQEEAAALCDRVAFMDAGHVWQVDTYRNLLVWPRSLRVADFVTEPGTHFVEGAVMEGHFACPRFNLPLTPAVAARVVPGQAVTMRVPPRSVSLANGNRPVVLGEVEWIEPLPMHRAQRVTCRAGEASLALALDLQQSVQIGETLALVIDADEVQVFDSRTGVNLATARL